MENFNLKMEKIIEEHKGEKPTLLLHSCCAPCSSSVLERLVENFKVTIFYYNPNIDTLEEYQTRVNEQIRLCKTFDVEVIASEHCKQDFINAVKGLEKEKEGGARCAVCFKFRLTKTAEVAKNNGFDYFATTLTVSPLKNATLINGIGEEIGRESGVKYLPSDFKKKGGYLRSIELSKQHYLYRQNYCGCEFSKQKA